MDNENKNHEQNINVDKNTFSISIRDKLKIKNNFFLKLVNYKRNKPKYKNLKYKTILNYLSKMNTTKSDVALCVNNKILETGTSNLLFISNN